MRYQDILPDVLVGKLVRSDNNLAWLRMLENGKWTNTETGGAFSLSRKTYLLDTWEVKQEELYVFFNNAGIDSGYIQCDKSEATHKLIPVDEEPKTENKKEQFTGEGWSIMAADHYMLEKHGKGWGLETYTPEQVRIAYKTGREQGYQFAVNNVMEEYFEKGKLEMWNDINKRMCGYGLKTYGSKVKYVLEGLQPE